MDASSSDESSSLDAPVFRRSSSAKGKSRRESDDGEDAALRSAVHFAVGRICVACDREEGRDVGNGATTSPKAIAALAELAYQYATTSLSNDLVCFSQHANRKTVTVDDCKLVARKSPSLAEALQRFCESNGLGGGTGGGSSKNVTKIGARKKGKAASSGRTKSTMKGVGKASKSTDGSFAEMALEQQRDALLKRAQSSSSSSSSGSSSDSDSRSIHFNFESDEGDDLQRPKKSETNIRTSSSSDQDLDQPFHRIRNPGKEDKRRSRIRSSSSGELADRSSASKSSENGNRWAAKSGKKKLTNDSARTETDDSDSGSMSPFRQGAPGSSNGKLPHLAIDLASDDE